MNTEQAAAIDVFRELGWVGTTSEQWPTLPIGTSQQQRIVRDGLKSGDWDERDPEAFRLRSAFPDDIDCIALVAFAIRCGITARRAVSLHWSRLFSNDLHVALLTERGPRYAADYIERESSGHDIADVQETPRHGASWIQLVRDLDLEPPRRLGYAVAWTTLALKALNGESAQPFKAEAEEHLSLAVECGCPRTEPSAICCSGIYCPASAAWTSAWQGWSPRRVPVTVPTGGVSWRTWRSPTTRSASTPIFSWAPWPLERGRS